MHLHVHLRVRTVHHMKDHITVPRLLQSALERLHQMVRKLSDKSYCVRQKDLFPAWKRQRPRRRIQGREKLIFRQDPGSCELI